MLMLFALVGESGEAPGPAAAAYPETRVLMYVEPFTPSVL